MKKIFTKPDRAEGLQVFKYERLKSDEIRVLQLHASSSHGYANNAPFGNLKTIRLQDDSSSTSIEFEALSYFWGTGPADRKLYLNHTSFSIKSNLETALQELRKGESERLLWIDAICINQEDLQERNEQVRRMGLIYRRATRVIVWIGPRWTEGQIPAAAVIQRFVQRQRRGVDSQQLSAFLENPNNRREVTKAGTLFNSYTETKAVHHTGSHWPALVDFFNRPWWRRVWVRQELAMSQRAVVQCGDLTVDWTDVAAISHWLKVWATDLDERSRRYGGKVLLGGAWVPDPMLKIRDLESTNHRSGVYTGEDLEYFRQTLVAKGEIEFEKMLIHARNCESSDPRDKVYSILGLTGDAATDISVDYTLPVSAVAIQAFRKLVSRNKSLDALIWSQNPGRQKSIPSWAPNLLSPFSTQPSRLKSKTSSFYAAAGLVQRKEQFEFLEDGITLSIKGAIIFDVVRRLSPMLHAQSPKEVQLDSVMSEWKPLVFEWLGTMEIEQKYERFMSALTCDMDIRNRRLPKRADGLDWGNFFRIDHFSVGARTEFEYLALGVRRSAFEGTTSGQTELNDWLKLCTQSIGGRRMIMTSEGRIGLVPAETQQWDVVCLLGLDVPFILRKIDADTYIVIGEAYIHGAMDGEIISTQGSSYARQIQDIKIQ